MTAITRARQLDRLLRDEGLPLPEHCRVVELVFPASGAAVIRYEVFISPEDLPKLARVLAALGEADPPIPGPLPLAPPEPFHKTARDFIRKTPPIDEGG